MMKIGLVGEAPNDVQSMKNLLSKKYPPEKVEFLFMLQIINGSALDSQRTKRLLRIEYETQKPDVVIFIRDLDAILPNKEKLAERKEYFTNSNSVVNKKGIHLLHVFEIEALILSDIDTFNEIYQTNIAKVADVMQIYEPKEVLKKASKKYNESQNAKIFEKLDFNRTLECSYFEQFISKLNRMISHHNF